MATAASASFLIVTSEVEPCPVITIPSAAAYPMAALSPLEVSPSGSNVAAVATPTIFTLVVPVGMPITSASASFLIVTSLELP